jgi:hypothetical protein
MFSFIENILRWFTYPFNFQLMHILSWLPKPKITKPTRSVFSSSCKYMYSKSVLNLIRVFCFQVSMINYLLSTHNLHVLHIRTTDSCSCACELPWRKYLPPCCDCDDSARLLRTVH